MKKLLLSLFVLAVGTCVSLFVAAELDARTGEPFVWQVRLPSALLSNLIVLGSGYYLARKYGERWGFTRKP